jgi:hypothetical protein
MENKVIIFVNYRKLKLTEIQLTLTENHWGVIVVQIADEITAINKHLATLRNTKNKMMQNQYNYFYRAKESLINVTEKIDKYFFEKREVEVKLTFDELDHIVGMIESKLQDIILIKEDTPEYKNLCYVYKALLPVYNQNKSILEYLNTTK